MTKEDLDLWKKRITAGERLRNNEAKSRNWSRFVDEYQGKYNVVLESGINIIPINLVFGYVNTEIPNLYFRDPYTTVNARGFQYIQRAKIIEHVINYLKAELNIKQEIEKVLIDSLLIGHGWMKVGYSGTFGTVKVSGTEKKGKKTTPVEETSEFIKSEEIFAVHVPYDDIVFDTISKDPPHDSRWIAHSFIKPLEAVRESELYDNTQNLKTNISVTSSRDEIREKVESDLELVKLWEIWDKDTNKIFVVSENHEKFLRNVKNIYEMEGFPFMMLGFNHVPNSPYPLSDISLVEDQILERIKLRSMMLNHLKRWNRQLSIEEGSMNQEEMEKFMLGIDGSVIRRKKGSAPPVPISYAPMQSEIVEVDDLVQRDMDSVIGQIDVQRGGVARGETKTLGELQLRLGGAQNRSSKRQDVVEDFIEEVDRKLIQLLKQFQTVPKYVRISGKSEQEIINDIGRDKFDGTGFNFTRDDIQGEFDVEVKAGSSLPLSKQNRIQVLSKLLEFAPALGIQPGGRVSRALGKEILRDLDIKEVERAYDEEEVLLQRQQQVAQQQQQIAQTQSQGIQGLPPSPQGVPIEPLVPTTDGRGGQLPPNPFG